MAEYKLSSSPLGNRGGVKDCMHALALDMTFFAAGLIALNRINPAAQLFDNYYRTINTKFKYHDEEYQPTPWLKAYYSLNNWNNTQESPPY